jgi:1-hydroxycarotenoid 3,4-desaturase
MGVQDRPIVVVGAGMGGLVAAALLAARGRRVLVLEQAAGPGGKVGEAEVDGVRLSSGPARLTMRPVFEAIFRDAGGDLSAALTLAPEPSLGRHLWADGTVLDLPADPAAAEAAIGAFAGAAAARGYQAFRAQAKRIHDALEAPFLMAQRPGALALAARTGLRGLLGSAPFASLWEALGAHFADPRLRQVFARLATYVGTSPLQAPATLMLVAHVESQGLWRVRGGLARLPEAVAALAARHGAAFRYGAAVREITLAGGRAAGVTLAAGEHIPAAAVLCNAEAAALAEGRFGAAVAGAVERLAPERRSFSAITWAMRAGTEGLEAAQTVLHAPDAAAEYAELGYRARLPARPTFTLWAEDRAEGAPPPGPERLLGLVCAPARADLRPLPPEAVAACGEAVFGALARLGIVVHRRAEAELVTTPTDFARRYPGSGGALYGPAMQGWQAAFSRPGARTRLPGLYLAGGSAHPGAGVAMAAISGRLAAARLLEDHP